jgi:AraC-like DNA-binding protein
MIALVRLLPPDDPCLWVECLTQPPVPTAARHSGYLVRCGDGAELDATLEWYSAVRAVRPSVPLGLVCAAEVCAGALGRAAHPVQPLISPNRLSRGRVPAAALAEMRAVSVESRILEEMCWIHGDRILTQQTLLEVLISHAASGGTLKRLSRQLGLSDETLRRRLEAVGLRPKPLMAGARLRAYDLRVELGDRPANALLACGWTDPKSRQKVRRRLAQNC